MPKKKGGKGAKTKEKKEVVVKEDSEFTKIKKELLEASKTQWVSINLNLMNWSFMNSELQLPLDATLYELKERLRAKHGAMTSLKVCKDSFAEANEMNDDEMTLEEYGFEGNYEGEPSKRFEVYYDFKPTNHSDPLMLVWNNRSDPPPRPAPPREVEGAEEKE